MVGNWNYYSGIDCYYRDGINWKAYNYFKDKTEKEFNYEEIIIHKPEDELFKLKKLSEKVL